jgi:glutamate-1-semialdehyde 2,1-aminomutase
VEITESRASFTRLSMSAVDEYLKRTPVSRKLYEEAYGVFPSGVTRAPFFMWPYPTFLKRANGCLIWDVDENEYVDYVCNMGPLILGHSHPNVIAAVTQQLATGFWIGGVSELEVKLAERVAKLYPSVEQLSFCPSGTEACMNAARAVRAYSGKERIITIEGAYHGSSDSFYSTAGVPKYFQEKVTRVPFNDTEALEKSVKELKGELAAVFIEPVLGQAGGLAPMEGYLQAAREITERNDVLLVFDEVVTGFRIAPGGAAERFGVRPDVAIFGKVLGGGFSCGAFGGNEEIMDSFTYPPTNSLEVVNPRIRHPGTFNDHKISMVAGLATLDELTPSAYLHLENLGERIRNGLTRVCLDLHIKAQVTGIASIFHIHFSNEEIVDFTSASKANSLLIRYYDIQMANRGINLAKAHSSFCSTPLTDRHVDQTIDAMGQTLTAMKPAIREVAPSLIMQV